MKSIRKIPASWAQKLIVALSTSLGVVLLAFFTLRIVPGDPVDLILGESASGASRELLRAQLGLDGSLIEQLVRFFTRLIHADLGVSIATGRPVVSMLADCLPATLLLTLTSAGLANLAGVLIGLAAAGSSSRKVSASIFFGTALVLAVPAFWLGPVLVLCFSLHWPWLPVSASGLRGVALLDALWLPAASLGLALCAQSILTTRAAMIECLSGDYIRTAYAKGASKTRVLFAHALPNALIPILTVSLLQFGNLLAGAVLTETVFDWPGIGKLLVEAVLMRDYPVVQGAVLLTTICYVFLNFIADLLSPGRDAR